MNSYKELKVITDFCNVYNHDDGCDLYFIFNHYYSLYYNKKTIYYKNTSFEGHYQRSKLKSCSGNTYILFVCITVNNSG